MTGNDRFLRATCVGLLMFALWATPAWAGPLETARAAAKKADWKTAAEAYAKVLETTPEHRDAAIGLTEAAVKADAPDLYQFAEDALLGLREKNPRDWSVILALGKISQALSASKEDTLAKKSYDTQATECFGAVLKAQPSNEGAAAGAAQVLFQSAQFQAAIETVDKFLAARPLTSAKALFWKGQALYYMAQDAFRASGNKFPLAPQVASSFRKAQGAFRGAAAGAPTHFEAWMQLAYASAWVSDRATALEGYRKALMLKQESDLPFRGIKELLKQEQTTLEGVLRDVVAKAPKHSRGLYELGRNRLAASEHNEAAGLFEQHIKVASNAAAGWYYLGKSADGLGDATRAKKAYIEALKANPDDIYSAWELDTRIRNSELQRDVTKSVKDAHALIAEYEKLFKLAPRNASVRNNLAFTLREAYGRHRNKTWLPILKECTRVYVEASKILGEWTAEKEASLNWQQRYGQAQIISDTGLMFQFYPETQDLDKAMEYYETALEYTEDGYRDAFNNYSTILAKAKRWDDLYELAKACSQGLRTEQGQPDNMTRNRASSIMKKLIADGLVKD